MTVRPPNPETRQEALDGTGTPRWVKVFGAVSLAVVLLVVILLLTGGGGHGPSRHTGGDPAPSGVTEHTPPVDSQTTP